MSRQGKPGVKKVAIFASLADKLQETFKKLRGKGKLTEADVTAAMREI